MRSKLLIIILLVTSCTNNTDNHEKNTAKKQVQSISDSNILSQYLNYSFNYQLPDDSVAFLFLSSTGCSGCLHKIFDFVSHGKNIPNSHVIISQQMLLNYDIDSIKSLFWIDTANLVDHLKYHKGNVAIAWFYKQKLSRVQAIVPDQIDLTLSEISKQ